MLNTRKPWHEYFANWGGESFQDVFLCGALCCSETSQSPASRTEEKTLEETPGPPSKLNQGATVTERECITSTTTVKSNTVNRRNDEKPQRSAENNQISSNKTLKTTQFYFLVLHPRQQCSRSCSAFTV